MYVTNLMKTVGNFKTFKLFSFSKDINLIFRQLEYFLCFRRVIKRKYIRGRLQTPKNFEYYRDRLEFVCIFWQLWRIFKYNHILDEFERTLFVHVMEFLMEYWIVSDYEKDFRNYMYIAYMMESKDFVFKHVNLFSPENVIKYMPYVRKNGNISFLKGNY